MGSLPSCQDHGNAHCPSHNAPHHWRVKGLSQQPWLATVLRPSIAHLKGCSAWVCAQVVSSSAACNLGEGLTVYRPVQGNESAHCPSHNAPHHWRVKGSSSSLSFLSPSSQPPLNFLPPSSQLPPSFLSASCQLPFQLSQENAVKLALAYFNTFFQCNHCFFCSGRS